MVRARKRCARATHQLVATTPNRHASEDQLLLSDSCETGLPFHVLRLGPRTCLPRPLLRAPLPFQHRHPHSLSTLESVCPTPNGGAAPLKSKPTPHYPLPAVWTCPTPLFPAPHAQSVPRDGMTRSAFPARAALVACLALGLAAGALGGYRDHGPGHPTLVWPQW